VQAEVAGTAHLRVFSHFPGSIQLLTLLACAIYRGVAQVWCKWPGRYPRTDVYCATLPGAPSFVGAAEVAQSH
jgi:hypothetical protein